MSSDALALVAAVVACDGGYLILLAADRLVGLLRFAISRRPWDRPA